MRSHFEGEDLTDRDPYESEGVERTEVDVGLALFESKLTEAVPAAGNVT